MNISLDSVINCAIIFFVIAVIIYYIINIDEHFNNESINTISSMFNNGNVTATNTTVTNNIQSKNLNVSGTSNLANLSVQNGNINDGTNKIFAFRRYIFRDDKAELILSNSYPHLSTSNSFSNIGRSIDDNFTVDQWVPVLQGAFFHAKQTRHTDQHSIWLDDFGVYFFPSENKWRYVVNFPNGGYSKNGPSSTRPASVSFGVMWINRKFIQTDDNIIRSLATTD